MLYLVGIKSQINIAINVGLSHAGSHSGCCNFSTFGIAYYFVV
jgi:transketolase C-terminal domain/subunit